MTRVMVSGGAGYIGSVIVSHLLSRGYGVLVFDDLSRGHREAVAEGAHLVIGDVRDQEHVEHALRSSGCRGIVHMAALAEVAESIVHPQRYRDVNEGGTHALTRAALSSGVERIVYSSTAAVYGEPDETPILETAVLKPGSPYGKTKLAGEHALLDAQAASEGRLAVTCLRYFNACGAYGGRGEDHHPESHLIPLALCAARDGVELAVFGDDYATPDGTCIRDYVHVADLALAHVLALERLPAASGPINLGTGRGASVLEVVRAVERATGRALMRRIEGRRAGDPPVLVASNERALDLLAWRPSRTLHDAVADAWAWMLEHPRGYGTAATD